MKSAFRFMSYKVDSLELKIRNSLGMLQKVYFDEKWGIEFGLRIPQYWTNAKVYIAGLECKMTYPPLEGDPDGGNAVEISGGAMGMFEVEEGRFAPEVEKDIVTKHLPTLVMPYLRSTLTSVLANSGIGIHVFPLVNLHEVAAETLKNQDIIVHP